MTEQKALLKTIAENKDDLTPRLVYADWLDENPLPHFSRKCTICVDGKQNDCEIGDITYNEWDCASCGGTGKIETPNTRNADRAAFIRVQCELATKGRVCPFTVHRPEDELDRGGKVHMVPPPREPKKPCRFCPICKWTQKERELLDKYRRIWLCGGRCVTCSGSGRYETSFGWGTCHYCEGTGRQCWPLAKGRGWFSDNNNRNDYWYNIKHSFWGGFLDYFEIPFDQFIGNAQFIGQFHPTVRRVSFTDKTPRDTGLWVLEGGHLDEDAKCQLPEEVYRRVAKLAPASVAGPGRHRCARFDSVELASKALSDVCVELMKPATVAPEE